MLKRCLRFDEDHFERRWFGLLWMDRANNCGIPFNFGDEEVSSTRTVEFFGLLTFVRCAFLGSWSKFRRPGQAVIVVLLILVAQVAWEPLYDLQRAEVLPPAVRTQSPERVAERTDFQKRFLKGSYSMLFSNLNMREKDKGEKESERIDTRLS